MDDQDGMRAIGAAVNALAVDPNPPDAFIRGDYRSRAIHETSNLCRALGLLAVGGDWRDRSYGLTDTGKATTLEALRARGTGPRTIPWPLTSGPGPAVSMRKGSLRSYSYVQRCTISVMASMTVSEARAALPELLSRVEEGEEITITRHGRTVAVLVRPDALRSRRADAALEDAGRIHELLTQATAEPLPEGPGLTAHRAEELIAAIRAGRDAR